MTFRSLREQRFLIWQLAKYQLRQQYAATFIGSFWAIFQPVATILVFWFVFSYGFKIQFRDGDFPFFIVLFCGFAPWLYFADALSGGTSSVVSHSYLVKKIAFPLEILPIVHLVVAYIVHIFLTLFIIFILIINGIKPTIYIFQLAYYMIALSVFSAGFMWLLAALNTFQRDIGQSIGVILTLWFWLTPIVWPIEQLPETAQRILKINPVYYIVNGYRDSLLYQKSILVDWQYAIYFWAVSVLILTVGIVIFNRMKYHFADVL